MVSGPSVMQGYFGNDEATRARSCATTSLWTGDLGYLADGALYVTGRAKDLLIVHGKNYYAEEHLERVVEPCRRRAAGGVVAFSVYDEEEPRDVVVIVCEAKGGGREGARADRQADRRRGPAALRRPGGRDRAGAARHHPQTPSGKPQRNLTREMYLQDRLTPTVTGKLDLVIVMARSGAGFLLARARRLFGRRADCE